MNNSNFHFQPFSDSEFSQTDNAPLLFSSQPPGRSGSATVFFKTRRALRQRLGVHDLGALDSVFGEKETRTERGQMQMALSKVTQWSYLFPPVVQTDVAPEDDEDEGRFGELLQQALGA